MKHIPTIAYFIVLLLTITIVALSIATVKPWLLVAGVLFYFALLLLRIFDKI